METGKSSSNSDIAKALVYEFCGSALITYAYNLGDDYLTRSVAYFIGFLIAVNVSGAHFNPATSLAVFIINRKYKEQIKYLGLVIFIQFCGCYAGLLVSYLIVKTYGTWTLYPAPVIYYDTITAGRNVYFGRVILQELLQTFTFTLVFLIIRFELRKLNIAVQGLGIAHALFGCY